MTRRLPIAARFVLLHLAVAGLALLLAGIAGFFLVRDLVMEDADEALVGRARVVAETFRPLLSADRPDTERIAREGDRLGRDIGARVTIVFPDGTVAADSAVGAAGVPEMENHAAHPEVRDALAGGPGFSMRRSITTRQEQRYAAVPIRSGERLIGVARVSVPGADLSRRLWKVSAAIWGTGGIALLLILLGAALAARRVTGPLSEIREAAREMASGNLSRTARVRTGDEFEETAETMNEMASRLGRTIAELDEGKARLSTLLSCLADGVIVAGPEGTVRTINPEALRLLDIAGAPAERRPLAEVVRNPRLLAFLDAWLRGESLPDRDVDLPGSGGGRTIRVSGTKVRYRGEAKEDVLVTLRDVTEERHLAQVKSDFVSNASHELRTPLTSVRGYIEAAQDALREGATPEPAFLETAHANALRMERLLDDLLELSRSESGAPALKKEAVPLREFLPRVAGLHRAEAERRGVALAVSAGEGPVRADLRKLTLALSNLVDNALKYGGEGCRVTLSGRVEEGGCVMEVADDGPGIPPEHLPRIFERFYRVDKGRSRELGGTGLGLSIARHIVESHGGTIRVENRPGAGARFTIRIPA